jgi:hypothetical protein
MNLEHMLFMADQGYQLLGNVWVKDNGKCSILNDFAYKILTCPMEELPSFDVRSWSKFFFGMDVPEDMVRDVFRPLAEARGYGVLKVCPNGCGVVLRDLPTGFVPRHDYTMQACPKCGLMEMYLYPQTLERFRAHLGV